MTARFNKTVIENLTEVEKMRFTLAYLYHQNPSEVCVLSGMDLILV